MTLTCLAFLGLWLFGVSHVATQARSARDGVYTAEQAGRGQQQYDVFCISCHGADMEGGGVDVPALVDTAFVQQWSGRPLRDMFDLIKLTMPENAPGSLSDGTYADLLSYILQANGLSAGATPLDPLDDALERILFEEPALGPLP